MDDDDKKLEAFFKKTKKMMKNDGDEDEDEEEQDEEDFDPSKAKFKDFFAAPKYVFKARYLPFVDLLLKTIANYELKSRK
jgi:hypothetical protein